jgi:hypothetical protein
MKKLPRGVYSVIFLILALIGILVYGFYYENYLKPVDCGSRSINDCPARCAICPACRNCELACRATQDCKDSGFYDEQFEQIRTHQAMPDPVTAIKEAYEPALKQYPAYDHMVIGECENTLCVQIYLKEDSADLKSKMPAVIDDMKVIYIIANKADAKDPVKDPAAGDDAKKPADSGVCGIESCHGMDIVCGSKVPEACTAVYMLGDGCRQFAKCEITGGKCKIAPSDKFDQCKACVQKCEIDFSKDSMKMFECEYNCQQFAKR